jgi:hypothetical protein
VPILPQAREQLVERLLVADLLQSKDVDVVVERGRDHAVELGPNGWPVENRFSTSNSPP